MQANLQATASSIIWMNRGWNHPFWLMSVSDVSVVESFTHFQLFIHKNWLSVMCGPVPAALLLINLIACKPRWPLYFMLVSHKTRDWLGYSTVICWLLQSNIMTFLTACIKACSTCHIAISFCFSTKKLSKRFLIYNQVNLSLVPIDYSIGTREGV